MEYYLGQGNERRGPFDTSELVSQGMQRHTLVWRQGMADWQPAETVAELRHLLNLPPFPNQYPGLNAAPPPPAASYPPYDPASTNSKRIAAGICGILLGSFGVHKFIVGLPVPGAIMLAITLCSCGFAVPIVHVVGLIEGIVYLTRTDPEFYQLYAVEKRPWF